MLDRAEELLGRVARLVGAPVRLRLEFDLAFVSTRRVSNSRRRRGKRQQPKGGTERRLSFRGMSCWIKSDNAIQRTSIQFAGETPAATEEPDFSCSAVFPASSP